MADETNSPATGDDKEKKSTDQLGDAGKKALEEERRARREAEARLKELEPIAARAQELEDAQKSNEEKLAEKVNAAEARARKAEIDLCRYRVALKKGLTETQARRLVGDDETAMETDADELLEAFGAKKDVDKTTDREPPATGRPKEKLRPGAVSDAEPDPDPAEVLAAIPRI